MTAARTRARLPARDAAMTEAAHPTRHNELSQRIAALNELTAQQLRDEWRRLYRGQPPRLSRDLLIRTIAYRMQELAYGGLSKATQRKLDALTKELERKGTIVITPRSVDDGAPRSRPQVGSSLERRDGQGQEEEEERDHRR
jgi:hypothetical protein